MINHPPGDGLETEADLVDRGVVSPRANDSLFSFTPRRLLLQWHLTDRCDLRCRHCYQAAYQAEMSYDVICHVLEEYSLLLGKWNATGHVNLTGGEPFLHPHLFQLMAAISKEPRFGCALLSNGTCIDRSIARELARLKCRFVQISMEGGESVHDSIRGPGTFAKAAQALKELRKAGVSTMISFTVHRGNRDEFPKVVALGRRLKANVVWSDRLLPMGGGKDLSSNQGQCIVDWKPLIE
jgi:MoaA/NifB/PqqE/SkfB family radical SAM enzyme